MPGAETIAIVVCVFLAAAVSGISGFGFMLVLVPPLSILLGPGNGVVVANVISPLQAIIMFALLRRSVRWRTLGLLLAAGAVGMPLGAYLLAVVPAGVLRVGIAVSVLAGTYSLWRGVRFEGRGPAVESLAGFISGVLKTSTGINGPPVVLYLQGIGLDPLAFRATMAAFFLATSVMAVAVLGVGGQVSGEHVRQAALGLPALFLGAIAGHRLFPFLSAARFRQMILVLLAASSVVVLATAILG